MAHLNWTQWQGEEKFERASFDYFDIPALIRKTKGKAEAECAGCREILSCFRVFVLSENIGCSEAKRYTCVCHPHKYDTLKEQLILTGLRSMVYHGNFCKKECFAKWYLRQFPENQWGYEGEFTEVPKQFILKS